MNPHFTHQMALLGLATLCTAALLPRLSAQTADSEHLTDNVFGQMSWKELGPVSSGGRITDIAEHPTKPQIFWAARPQGQTQRMMLRQLLDRAFSGSPGSLVLQALSMRKSTPEELQEIRELLEKLEERGS